MPSKDELLDRATVKELKKLAKDNKVKLEISGFWGTRDATTKEEIIEVLSESRKVSKAKILAMMEDREEKSKEKAVKPSKGSLMDDVKRIKKIIENTELIGTEKTKESEYEGQLVIALKMGLGNERVTYEKPMGRSRLDIVVDSVNNKQIGIELKLYTGGTSIDRLFGQIDRYLESVYDRVIAVVITKKSIAAARAEAKRIEKFKNVDVIVKRG